ncbi:MAG: hypothetical protein LBH51_06325 [Treponema sp.]|jgi:hypothetical protein|nr:hypothetical protein [Treponema sp.]
MKFLLPVLAVSVLVSCASASFHELNDVLEDRGYEKSVEFLEKSRRKLYGRGDAVLYYLDKGMLTHYAGFYEESSGLLEEGERAIEAAFTKSIIQETASYLINDNTRDYGGEDYEDIYTNSFNALNYYHRGDMEEALVEIRRMNNKIRGLADKYGVAISALQKRAMEESLPIPPNAEAPSAFNDSALARYLGMLFYRGAGYADDARIDGDYLRLAFANAPKLYPHPLPGSLDGELNIPPGMARLNLLAFAGLSPVKRENTFRLPIGEGHYVKISLPELEYRPSRISRVEAVFDDGRRFPLELLEDIGAIAGETYKARENFIYLKTIIRASLKGMSSAVFDSLAEETEGGGSALFGLLSLSSQLYAEMSEQADLRISRYFPSHAYVGGINLSPGRYSFNVVYYNSSGKAVGAFRYEDVPVLENRLNLTEAVCLK